MINGKVLFCVSFVGGQRLGLAAPSCSWQVAVGQVPYSTSTNHHGSPGFRPGAPPGPGTWGPQPVEGFPFQGPSFLPAPSLAGAAWSCPGQGEAGARRGPGKNPGSRLFKTALGPVTSFATIHHPPSFFLLKSLLSGVSAAGRQHSEGFPGVPGLLLDTACRHHCLLLHLLGPPFCHLPPPLLLLPQPWQEG